MIRRCGNQDFELTWAIINDGAHAYKGIIPKDCWTEPYLSTEELQEEVDEGVVFWGYEEAGTLVGVMGLQQVRDGLSFGTPTFGPAARSEGSERTCCPICVSWRRVRF
jgi:hypothetical protein